MRKKIKKAAIQYLEQAEYEALCLKEIASELGIELKTVTALYPAKEALYLDLAQDCIQLVVQSMEQVYQMPLSYDRKLFRLFKLFAEFHPDFSGEYRFFLQNFFFPPPALLEELSHLNRQWHQRFATYISELFDEAHAAGEITEVERENLVHAHLAFSYGNMLLTLNENPDYLPEGRIIAEKVWENYWLGNQKILYKGAEENA